jgi:hypothetical protein
MTKKLVARNKSLGYCICVRWCAATKLIPCRYCFVRAWELKVYTVMRNMRLLSRGDIFNIVSGLFHTNCLPESIFALKLLPPVTSDQGMAIT